MIFPTNDSAFPSCILYCSHKLIGKFQSLWGKWKGKLSNLFIENSKYMQLLEISNGYKSIKYTRSNVSLSSSYIIVVPLFIPLLH